MYANKLVSWKGEKSESVHPIISNYTNKVASWTCEIVVSCVNNHSNTGYSLWFIGAFGSVM
jgi:hypothetical protein